jgi:hypothetical protein
MKYRRERYAQSFRVTIKPPMTLALAATRANRKIKSR